MTRLPAHEALSRWAYPMGAPLVPSDEDMANARAFVAGMDADRAWIRAHRDTLVRNAAFLFMAKRMSADKVIRDAVERDEIGEAA